MTQPIQRPVVVPGVPCGWAGAVSPPPFLASRPGPQQHRCHSRNLPTGTGPPRWQSDREPRCSRRWFPRSGSSVPASHENPPPGAICCSAAFCAAYSLVAATGSSAVRVELDVAGVNHQPPELLHSKSGSSMTVSRRSFHTPWSRQRQKRRWVFFQSPKSGGRSRQGTPALNYQDTAFRNNRLSLPGRPFFPGPPGKRGSRSPQTRSEISWRRCGAVMSPPPHVHSHHTNLPSGYDFNDTP